MRPSFYPFNRVSISLLISFLLSALTFQIQAQSGSVTTTQSFSYTGQIVTWTVPTGVTSLTIEARGAEGAAVSSTHAPGKGAIITGTVMVTPGQQLSILVGQQPVPTGGVTTSGGGGGSFVVRGSNPVQPLVIAGGGGGSGGGDNSANLDSDAKNGQAGTNGGAATARSGAGTGGMAGNGGRAGSGQFAAGGGGGLLTDGTSSGIRPGGKAFVNGGTGGRQDQTGDNGGFGGGGSGLVLFDGGNVYLAGGGGGGYSGGGGSSINNSAGVGGGGGSFTAGTRLFARTGATDGNSGNGLVTITYATPPQPIRYVRQGGSGTGDGTSWANASGDLQSQINIAGAEQVWVAQGTYKPGPAGNTNRGISFVMKEGVAIYGGFVGSESSLSDRPAVNPVMGQPSSTTLSGDIGTVGNNSDNSNLVIANTNNNLTIQAILDGFVIVGGNGGVGVFGGGGIFNNNSSPSLTNLLITGNFALIGGGISNSQSSPVLTNCTLSANSSSQEGGGVHNSDSSPTLTNCTISSNTAGNGGGIYNFLSSPKLTNCTINGNTASSQGGGIHNFLSSPKLTNCTLSGNTASDQGGGIYNIRSSPVLTNCLLANNTASNQGGAFHNFNGSNPRLVNCTLTGNSAGDLGGAISEDNATSQLTNAILFNNGGAKAFRFLNGGSTTLTYSLIESGATGYTSGPGNQTATVSPFVSGSDFQLTACSIAIDAGDNGAYSAVGGPATDLAGNPRPVRQIDLGAYEFQGTPAQPIAINQQPVSGSSVTPGASVSVPVSVSGTVSTYQWYKDNLNSPVTGQTSATLTLTNVQAGDAGSYSLVVTGACNSVTSTAFSLTVSAPAQPIRYVKAGGTGDGTSWANASGDLQSQIDIAGAEQVWVAGGRYTSTANNGSFSLKSGVAVYGGFVGGEQNLTDRPGVNPVKGQPSSTTLTTASGSVLVNLRVNNTALDGFVITGGNNTEAGGGMINVQSSVNLINLLITGNTAQDGGGILNFSCSPSLTNCAINNNTASNQGGGINNGSNSSPSLTNCIIRGNTAANQGGGVYNNFYCIPVFTNCLLAGNTANQGGAFHNFSNSTPRLVNCTLSGNSASDQGGAFSEDDATSQLTSCILWNNGGAKAFRFLNGGSTSLTYSLIESGATGYTSGPGNQTATVSPFVSGTDFTLRAGSQAIDAGDPASTNSGSTDLAGNPRLANGRIDQGAYEFQGPFCQPIAITQQPASGSSVCVGSTVTAIVSVTGSNPTYQWYKDGQVLTGVASATTATLTLTNVPVTSSGTYSVVVTGTCNSVTSTAFSLTVTPPPTAALTNNGPISCSITSVTVTASGGGTGETLSYQFSNGASQIGNGPTATVSTAGVYSVTVISGNGCSSVASTTVTGNTIPPATPTLMTSATLTLNQPISVTASGCNGSLNWSLLGGAGTANGSIYTLTTPGNYTLSASCQLNGCTSASSSPLVLRIDPAGPLTLLAPGYDCATGAFTFNTASGDGSPIEYFAIGITPWTSNPNQQVEADLRADPKKIQLLVRQNGLTVSYLFDLPAYCAGLPAPPQSSTNPAPVAAQGINAQVAVQNQPYRFTIPVGTFTDPDGEPLTYYALALPTGLSLNGSLISGTPTTTGRVVVTLIAVDPSGQTANTSFWFTVEPPATDLVPLLYTRPTTVFGAQPIRVVVDVVELNGVASSGPITLRISKDARLSLSLDGSLTTVGSRPVQNRAWSLTGPSGGFYTLSTTAVIAGGGTLSVGLTGLLDPGATRGSLSISSVIVGGSGGEVRSSNNSDADKIDYFPQ